MATKILLGDWAVGIENLIEATGLNESQLRNAVNSALGELSAEGEVTVSGKAKIKLGGKDQPDTFKLSEKQLAKFTGGVSSPLRLFYFNQELLALESIMGGIDLNGWPEYIARWMGKFTLNTAAPETP